MASKEKKAAYRITSSAGVEMGTYKVRLCNVNIIGQMCGWGEGATQAEAVERALAKARETGDEAWYDASRNEVLYRGRVLL